MAVEIEFRFDVGGIDGSSLSLRLINDIPSSISHGVLVVRTRMHPSSTD